MFSKNTTFPVMLLHNQNTLLAVMEMQFLVALGCCTKSNQGEPGWQMYMEKCHMCVFVCEREGVRVYSILIDGEARMFW